MIGEEAGLSLAVGPGQSTAEAPLGGADLCLLKFESHFIVLELVSFLEESGEGSWTGAVSPTGQGGKAPM